VLNHVQPRRIAEQPARKHLLPAQGIGDLRTLLDKDLNKGARFLRAFPRLGLFAARQLDHDIADAPRLAHFQDDILLLIVALVEQAERRHPILDRGAELILDRLGGGIARHRLGHVGGLRLGLGRTAASRERQICASQHQSPAHGINQPSGVQAS